MTFTCGPSCVETGKGSGFRPLHQAVLKGEGAKGDLLREGKITPDEFNETIKNLAHHLSKPGKPVTEAEARSLLEGLAQ